MKDHQYVDEAQYHEDWNPAREESIARVKKLLLQGVGGFFGGILVVLLVFGFGESVSGNFSHDDLPLILGMALWCGFCFAGIPFGWSVLNKIGSQWGISAPLVVWIVLFMLKLCVAAMIGVFAYPGVLVYNLINTQKSKRRIRITWAILIVVYVIFTMIAGSVAVNRHHSSDSTNAVSGIQQSIQETEAPRMVTVDAIVNDSDYAKILTDAALEGTREFEKADIEELGWKITQPAQVMGLYYLETEVTDDELLDELDVQNAIIIFSGYYVESGEISIDRWEMFKWVYPNFRYDEAGNLIYDSDEASCDILGAESFEEARDWMYNDYGDMRIVELNVPAE